MSAESTQLPCYKVVILGESGVGKTSLIQRAVFDVFTEGGPHAGRDEERKVICFKDGRQVELKLCDTAGQERVDLLTGHFYKGTDAIIFVYDITDSRTLWPLDVWIQDWNIHIERLHSIPVLFVGNKSDVARQPRKEPEQDTEKKAERNDTWLPERQPQPDEDTQRDFVELAQVKAITKRHNFIKTPLQCSAKTGDGVSKVFQTIAAEVSMVKPDPKPWPCTCL